MINKLHDEFITMKLNTERLKSLTMANEDKKIKYSEQKVTFTIGEDRQKYFFDVLRDANGDIIDFVRIERLCANPIIWNVKDKVANTIFEDDNILEDLNDLLYYSTKNVIFSICLNIDEFILYNKLSINEIDYITSIMDINGEVEIYFTVTENTVYYEY